MKRFCKFLTEDSIDTELKFENELKRILKSKYKVQSFSDPDVDLAQGQKRGLIITTEYGKFQIKIDDRS